MNGKMQDPQLPVAGVVSEVAVSELAEPENLQKITVDGVEIEFVGFNSMNDQKTVNAIVEQTSTHRCPACGLLEKEHMRVRPFFNEIDERFLKSMCLSPLHFGLNLFDHLINKVGGNQDFKLNVAKGDYCQQLKHERTKQIKDAFWDHQGIRISYMLKGQGTTNTGVCSTYVMFSILM